MNEVLFRCSLRLSLSRAAVSSSVPSPIRESSDPESGSRPADPVDPVPVPPVPVKPGMAVSFT